MTKYSKNKKRGLFYQLLFSNLLVCSIAIILISLAVFILLRSYIFESIKKNNQLLLNNTESVLEDYLSSANRISKELMYSPYIYKLDAGSSAWSYDMYQASQNMLSLMSANSFVDSIYFCTKDQVLVKANNSIVPKGFDSIMISQLSKEPSTRPSLLSPEGSDKKYISVLYGTRDMNDSLYNSAVIVNLDTRKIHELLYSGFLDDERDIIILNEEMEVFLSKDYDHIGKSFEDNRMTDILSGIACCESSSINIFEDNERFTYDIVKSSTGFVYLYKTPYWLGIQDILSTALRILLAAGIVFIFVTLSSIQIFRKIYKPIDQTFENIKVMFDSEHEALSDEAPKTEIQQIKATAVKARETLNKYRSKQQEEHLLEMLKTERQLSSDQANIFLSQMFEYQNGMVFICAVYRICGFRPYLENNSPGAINDRLELVKSFVEKEMQSFPCNLIFIADYTHIALLSTSMPDKTSELKELFSSLRDLLSKLLFLDVCLGLSHSTLTTEEIPLLYKSAYCMTKRSIFYGTNTVIDNDNILEASSDIQPNIYIQKLKELILQQGKEEFVKLFHEFHESISSLSHNEAMNIYIRLGEEMMSVGRLPADSHQHIPTETENRLRAAESYDEIEFIFLEIYEESVGKVIAVKSTKRNDLMEKTMERIRNDFTDPNITASIIAESIQVTPSYFSKIFKETFAMSFPEYVTKLRLSYGQELIETTDEDILQIALKCGFRNSSYFTAAFKKNYGITPSKYRLNVVKQRQSKED